MRQLKMVFLTMAALALSACAKLQPNAENQVLGQAAGTSTKPSSSSSKAITYFAFPTVPAVGTIFGTNILVQVPAGTGVTSLRAVILIDGVSVSVGGVSQISGYTQNDYSSPKIFVVAAQDGSSAMYTITVMISNSLKDLMYFNIPNVGGIPTVNGTNINVAVPYGTNVTNLVAAFLTNGASVKIGATSQTSGVTPNDYTTAKTYVVTAQDASTQTYTVTVTANLPTKQILSYSFGSFNGVVNGTNITVDVPYGANVISVTPTFQSNGLYVKIGTITQISGVTQVDLSTPKIYTVTAQDGTTQDYLVAANIGLNTSKDISSFSIPSLATYGLLNGTNITVNVPNGTNVTSLVATFTTTGASVKVGAATQTSGVTPNNFSSPLTYTVTAADASTQTYTVTVNVGTASSNAVAAFAFSAAGVTGTLLGNTITATVPYGTNVANLISSFSSTGIVVKVNGVTQTSGVTPNNFTSPVIYTVAAADGTISTYTVSITVLPPSSTANMLYFTLTTTSDFGQFSGNNIAVRVPTGTNLTNLVAIFKIDGSTVKVNGTTQFSGVTANDFSAPVNFIVTAQDGTTKSYTVTVTTVAYDVFAPQITSITSTPNAVNSYPTTVTVRVNYTEMGSGYQYGSATLCSPSRLALGTGGSQISVSSVTTGAGYFQGTVILHNYHEAGTWKVCNASLTDLAGNNANYYLSSYTSAVNYAVFAGGGMIDSGVPIGGAVGVSGTSQDVTAPQLTTITATPNSVNTYPATVTIRVNFSETGSGYQFGSASLCSPTRLTTGLGGSQISLSSLTSGAGYFQGTVNLQNYHEAGTWKVCSVYLADLAGNATNYYFSTYTSLVNYAVLTGSGFMDTGIPLGGAVAVSGTTQDVTAPQITSITATPNSVNAYPATVTIRVNYAETGSGYQLGSIWLCSPTFLATGTGGSQIYLSSLTSGAGYFQGTVTLQNYHETGTWKVCSASVWDLAGNSASYSATSFVSTVNYALFSGGAYVDSGLPISGAVNKQ